MRVVVAEDSGLVRQGIVSILADAGFEIAGQAADAATVIRLVEVDSPDVVILDIRMPPTFSDEGISVAQHIRCHHPNVGVLVLSQHLETAWAVRLLGDDPRGMGYLLKDRVASVAELSDAIFRVVAGETVVDPEIVTRLVARRRAHTQLDTLSERERHVLGLMAQGRSNRAIAGTLYIGGKTVETHIRSIFSKLNISDGVAEDRRVVAVLTYLREP